MNLFPMIQPQNIDISQNKLYKEVQWDFKRNVPIFKNGSPLIISGKDAVLTWAWKVLHTPRFRYEIYTWDYGCEIESLIGLPYTEEMKQSEASRYVKESLLINPYITGVSNITVSLAEKLSIECTIDTVYGEVKVNV